MRTLKNVNLEITSKCNFNCIHCGNNSGEFDKNNLTKFEILSLIHQMYDLGVERLGITGGEPFCDENLFDYLEYASERIPIISISTNGYLINEEKVNHLKQLGISKFAISIDGTEEYHDRFRRTNNAFKKALNAIKILSEANMEIKIRSVLTKDNSQSILNLMDITNNLKIKRHEILPVCPIGRASQEIILSNQEYKEFLIMAIEKLKSFDKTNITYQFKPVFYQEDLFKGAPEDCKEKSLSYKCDACDTSLEISYNGDIIGCSFIRNPIGNIRKNFLNEAWNSKEALDLYYTLEQHSKCGECGECQFNTKCNGGCYANKLYGKGIDKPDIYCFVRRK